ncbi:hypothetical protein [Oharaeibacter diazotrophicus]|uniref:hypothetical protein n=1 Tax=Oharaeibacter diazotrophicus TaxID=1920512 RepID=UPI000F819A20|nr:hypothetical protein [Oharaeibacter diazotrophicus]
MTAEDQRQIVDSVVVLTDLATAAAAVLGGLFALWGRWLRASRSGDDDRPPSPRLSRPEVLP